MMCDQIRNVKRLDMYELSALTDAGEQGGSFLDSIGKTDLAALSELEYREFLKRVVLGFGNSIRKQIREHKAPF